MQLTSSHTVHCLEKALTVQSIWESSSSNTTKKGLFSTSILTINVRRWIANLKFWSCIAATGQEDLCSHVESITSTNRIIRFPRGTETIIVYCPPPLFPLNDGISLLLLHFGGKRESLGERERKGRYGTERRCSHQPTGGGRNREKQLSGSLFKPPKHPGCVAVKKQASQRCQTLALAVHQPL